MNVSRVFGGLLLFAALTAPAGARALTIQVSGIDLLVSGAPGGRRADAPSRKVFVGDRAEVVALVGHDGTLRNALVAFTTTAPVTGLTPHVRLSSLLTGSGAHRLSAGWATFTTAGRYRVGIHVSHEGGAETADASFDIEVAAGQITAVIPPALVTTCLSPQVAWASPRPEGWVCLNEPVNLVVSPTLRACSPYTLTVTADGADGTSRVIGTRTASPWSLPATFGVEGYIKLKATITDRNGASAQALELVNVGRCVDRARFEHVAKLVRSLPKPDVCPVCGKLVQRLAALEKQYGTESGGLRALPSVLKELDALAAEAKAQQGGK